MTDKELKMLHAIAAALLDDDVHSARLILADVLDFHAVEDYGKAKQAHLATALNVH